jgi:hypothetical protein
MGEGDGDIYLPLKRWIHSTLPGPGRIVEQQHQKETVYNVLSLSKVKRRDLLCDSPG